MADTQGALFARLAATNSDFGRLAEKHRALDEQIGAYDRLYYLTSEQERKRKELQKRKLLIKDQLYAILRAEQQHGEPRNGNGSR